MPRASEATPAKSCEFCGKVFQRKHLSSGRLEDRGAYLRRRFCSISCSVSMQHATEPPTVAASRKRSLKTISGSCEACGLASNLSAHHVDGNPMNNAPINIQTLCLHCHNFWHAMLKRTGRLPVSRMPRLTELECCADLEMPLIRARSRNSSSRRKKQSET